MQTQAEYVIGRFGGIAATARAVRHRNSSTVQGWKERGTIPPKWYPELLIAGSSLTPPLEEIEFLRAPNGTPHRLEAPALQPEGQAA